MVSMCPFLSLLSPPSLKHVQLWASQFLKDSLLFNMFFPHMKPTRYQGNKQKIIVTCLSHRLYWNWACTQLYLAWALRYNNDRFKSETIYPCSKLTNHFPMNHVLLIEPKFFKTHIKLSRDYIEWWSFSL